MYACTCQTHHGSHALGNLIRAPTSLSGHCIGPAWVQQLGPACGFNIASVWVQHCISVGSTLHQRGFNIASVWVQQLGPACGFNIASAWVQHCISVGSTLHQRGFNNLVLRVGSTLHQRGFNIAQRGFNNLVLRAHRSKVGAYA